MLRGHGRIETPETVREALRRGANGIQTDDPARVRALLDSP